MFRNGCSSLIALSLTVATAQADDPTYWKDIRPILRKHCTGCHNAKNADELDVSGGLALDTYDAIHKGSRRPVMVPRKSGDSLLIQLVRSSDEEKRMPKDTDALDPAKINLLARWIDAGAKEGTRPAASSSATRPSATKRVRQLDVVVGTALTLPGTSGKLELMLRAGPLAAVTAVAFSPDGRWLANGAYGRVTIWDLTTGKPVKVLTNVLGAVNDVRFSPDGAVLAVAGGQPAFRGDVRLFETKNWQLTGTLGGHADVVFSVAFGPDGKRLASASFDKTVRIWDIATRKPQQVITSHSDFVYGVAFNPDGTWLASASKDRSVKITDLASGKSRATLSMEQDVLAVAISPDGLNVVSAGFDPPIHWWNPQTAERRRRQAGHAAAVHELCFSNDGKVLASAGADSSVRLWNGSTAALSRTLQVGAVTYSVAISPDGKRLASGSFDGLVRVWEVQSGRQLVTLASLPASSRSFPDLGELGSWLAVTPEGYADADEKTLFAAQWRAAGTSIAPTTVLPTLHRGDQVAKALRGEKVPRPKFPK